MTKATKLDKEIQEGLYDPKQGETMSALYKSIVKYKGKKYQVIDRYGIDRLSPTRRYYDHVIRLDLIPIGGNVPEDVITVDEDYVQIIEATSSR